MIKLPPRYNNIIKKLSGGGMSETLVCLDSHLDRSVVVKWLKQGVDPKRLLDEIAALAAIRSKHVVQIYDVIRSDDGSVAAVVEEYLSGDEIEGQPFPPNASSALDLLFPIASGIADIHSHGRVHRDIKPGNMKRDAAGCLKIFDFGLAKIDAVSAGTRNLYFTPGFTPPEAFVTNAQGKHMFTAGLDVFAFGSTALSLLSSGKPPADFFAIPPKLGGSGSDFRTLPQKLPGPIADLLNSCVAADPSARPSMKTVREHIARHLLFDKHRASIVFDNKESWLNSSNRSAKFSLSSGPSLSVTYDGFAFRVTLVSGSVFINNFPVTAGFELPGACVIVLGGPELGSRRGIISVAVSHPEVTL